MQISRFDSELIEVILGSFGSLDTGLGELVTEGEFDGVTFGSADFVGTPLSQTSFFPDLIQVNIRPELSRFVLSFEHAAPAFIGEAATEGRTKIGIAIDRPMAIFVAKLRVSTRQYYKPGNLWQ